MPTTAWSTRPDGYCDFLSDRWLDYAGYTAEQALGWKWSAVIHPDDAQGLYDYWTGCLATGTPVDTQARMRRHDGQYRWFLFRANPLRDAQGNITKWFGTNVDIMRNPQSTNIASFSSAVTNSQWFTPTGLANQGGAFDPGAFGFPAVSSDFNNNYDQPLIALAERGAA